MELSPQQQIFDQLRKANKVLIVLPAQLTADSLGSGLALKLFLTKLQKDASVVTSGQVPENLRFLPAADTVTSNISGGKSLVITVDASRKKLEEISYQTTDDKVHIYLKSQSEPFAEQDLALSAEKFPVDVIVTLDCASLEAAGEIFHQNADLFYETPKINIDHKAGNEFFGTINAVDVTATSVGEMLVGMLEQFEDGLVDEDIATALLAGIITKTHSFQHAHTTPQAFLKASRLVKTGGRQQEIIKHVYKTRSLALLKLWGRALARLKMAEELSLAYSVLNYMDFEKSEAGPADALPAFKELLENINGYNLVALVAEDRPNRSTVLLGMHLGLPADTIVSAMGAAGKQVLELPHYKVFEFRLEETSPLVAGKRLLDGLAPLKAFLSAST